MFLEAIKRLYEYQTEVNDHVLAVCDDLTDEELTAIHIKGQPSIRDTLVHMIDVVHINVAWWSGRLPGEDASPSNSQPVTTRTSHR